MQITKIVPRGFCSGVVNAWEIAKSVAENNKENKNVYMVGWLVHNKNLLDKMHELHIKTISDDQKSRLQIIEELESPEKSILIFSAHGTDPKAITLAKERGFETYDATCEYVYQTHNIVNEKISDGYLILFIGKKSHPETNSVLSLSKDIILLETEEDVDKLEIKEGTKIFVTNQTTISIYEFFHVTKAIMKKFRNAEFKNDICKATKERQEAVLSMDESIDLLIVVGDKKSNNSNKLVDIGQSRNVESYLIETKDDIKIDWLTNKKHVGITSGCSTPTWITNDVIMFLNEISEQRK